MPTPLRDPPPSSSVARLFDLDAAARAVAKSTEPHMPLASAIANKSQAVEASPGQDFARGERPHIKREVLLTPSADEIFSRIVDIYRRATGTRLTTSHVVRAMMRGVQHCLFHLEKEAKRIGPLKLPSNARGRELDRDRFEARIADAFIAGIRAAPAMDDDAPVR